MVKSPVFNAAYACSEIGSGVTAKATHANVTNRRSRRPSASRAHT